MTWLILTRLLWSFLYCLVYQTLCQIFFTMADGIAKAALP
jgi:hypothetical protein